MKCLKLWIIIPLLSALNCFGYSLTIKLKTPLPEVRLDHRGVKVYSATIRGYYYSFGSDPSKLDSKGFHSSSFEHTLFDHPFGETVYFTVTPVSYTSIGEKLLHEVSHPTHLLTAEKLPILFMLRERLNNNITSKAEQDAFFALSSEQLYLSLVEDATVPSIIEVVRSELKSYNEASTSSIAEDMIKELEYYFIPTINIGPAEHEPLE
jgi:hypothetical protein